MLSDCASVLQVGIVSVALSQSELLQKEVFLVEKVDAPAREVMTHLKAVAFVRPTYENIQHLKRHLTSPRFGEFHICMWTFSQWGGMIFQRNVETVECIRQVLTARSLPEETKPFSLQCDDVTM